MAKLLIDKGADMDAVDSMNRTPLFYALINEDKPLIKVNISKKGSTNNSLCRKVNLRMIKNLQLTKILC